MTETAERYSETRIKDSFTAYVLFSEPLRGTISEVMAAVSDDYPGLDWSSEQLGQDVFDTRGVTLSTDLSGMSRSDLTPRGRTSFIGSPGRCEIDWAPIIGKARFIFPDAQAAVDRHTDYLSVSVDSPSGDTSIAARFDAARRVTCIAAVLAKLPTALGVYFPNGDTLVTPENWVKAAETAMKGEVPLEAWVTFFLAFFDAPPEPLPVTVSTVGVAAFTGHEIVLPKARLEPVEAVKYVYGAGYLLLQAGHEFVDSDTLGVEGGAEKLRIRHVQEGRFEAQTDQWVLIHPSSGIDDVEMFGERSRKPPPPGTANEIMNSPDTLKNRLYSFVSGARP
ncbi:MAG: hypothetical protein AAFR35_14410 [Pseudomonadota bacterium]